MIRFLTEEQVQELTGKKTYSAQIRALRYMGIDHHVRPDGRPIVIEDDVRINPIQAPKPDTVDLDLSAI